MELMNGAFLTRGNSLLWNAARQSYISSSPNCKRVSQAPLEFVVGGLLVWFAITQLVLEAGTAHRRDSNSPKSSGANSNSGWPAYRTNWAV